MLQDYIGYLTNLRNNLIQSGVEYPINPIETYEDTFYEAISLQQILGYYRILNTSGSEDGIPEYFIPLTEHYKERMRQRFYKEFQEFLKDYKSISKLAYLAGESEQEEVEIQYDADEDIDLFDDTPMVEESETEETEGYEEVVECPVVEAAPIVSTYQSEDEGYFTPPLQVETSMHGTYLEDIQLSENEEKKFRSDEKLVETSCNFSAHGIYLDIVEEGISPSETAEHGTYLEDIVDEVESYVDDEDSGYYDQDDGIRYDENGFEIVDDEPTPQYDDDEYSEESNDIQYDENGFEIVDDEPTPNYDDEDDYYEESEAEGVRYDENGFEIVDDEPTPQYDDDEDYEESEAEGIKYDENGFEIVDDEPTPQYDDEDDYFEEEQVSRRQPIPQPSSEVQSSPVRVSTQETVQTPKGDMSDLLQNATNSLLTAGKRFVVKEQRKLKNMENK